ncbi:hypothetical protein [Synechococcus sp. ROS8604]|uniref:hypothetical protein n=1 Tax=Synechococcus sp. ROS8604 TaxID=1442557 RepID=UPI001645C984|nr:hypothetical protein [Synechococcus sp. ROS8604]
MTGTALQHANQCLMPAFRSAKEFPRAPKAEALETLYPALLQALNETNTARGLWRSSMDDKKRIILEVRAEIERLENDLVIEAQTRMQLHAMNEKLLAVLKEVDGFTEEISNSVESAHKTPRTGLSTWIERLKSIKKRWRAFKQRQQSLPVVTDQNTFNG